MGRICDGVFQVRAIMPLLDPDMIEKTTIVLLDQALSASGIVC
jgi:hypothetical protein